MQVGESWKLGKEEARAKEVDKEKWVCDSSVDYKGKVPLRASTGAWRASLFIIGIEFSERMSYFGIATSLIIYMTKVMHQDLKSAARSVNYWSGVTTLMPLFGGFLADAYLGRFCTVLISSLIYLVGLTLLTMSRLVPALRPCDGDICLNPRKIHEVIFFFAMYLISIGTGGHKPALESFGADQFDDDNDGERKKKMSFFNWWNSGLCFGLLLGVTLIVYVQDHMGWGAADIILTIVMAMSLVIFLVGRPCYRYRKPNGSPLTPLLQVLVAAIAKRKVPYPTSDVELYEDPKSQRTQGRLLCHTNKLKFLDKAAIVEDKESHPLEKQSPRRLATVTQVEEVKLIANIIPIWLSTLPFGILVSQTTTFFIKQSTTLDCHLSSSFQLPPPSIYSLAAAAMILTVSLYDRLLVPLLRRTKHNERGIGILTRIGIGMVFSAVAMAVAAMVESRRLAQVEQDPQGGSLSMSVFWLAPQFIIMGAGDGFAIVGLQEYFYEQVPDSMRSLGIALYLSVLGAANFLSSLLITAIDHLTGIWGKSWFGKDLNSSHLDRFYWLLVAIMVANLAIYVALARRYSYKSVQRGAIGAIADCCDGDATESMA